MSSASSPPLFAYVNADEVMASATALPAVCIIIMLLRFYTRYTQQAKLGPDDWLIVPAVILFIGMSACFIVGVKRGVIGYSTPVVHYANPKDALTTIQPEVALITEIEYAFQLLMIPALGLVKLSFIFFCRRVFVVQKSNKISAVTWSIVALVIMWTLGFLFDFAFSCGTYPEAEWAPPVVEAKYCSATTEPEKALTISDLILDLIVILLPLPFIWGLHTTMTRKLAVTGVFLLGGAAIGASIARLVIYMKLIYRDPHASVDRNLAVTTALYWSQVEAGLSIIAACLPSLRFLFAHGTPESLVRSIRSMLSLGSLRGSSHGSGSKHSNRSQQHGEEYARMNESKDSRVGINRDPSTEIGPSGVASEHGSERHELPQEPNAIYVQRSFRREEDHV